MKSSGAISNTLLNMSFDSNQEYYAWKRFHLARAKLQMSSKTSALLSGFVMVSMVEVNLDKDMVPEWVFIAFATCTSLVVAVYLIALLVSTCILPHLEAVASCKRHIASLKESPHVSFHFFVEMAWIFSTGVGIFLFLCQMVLLAWVRFNKVSQTAAIVTSVIVIPVAIAFVGFSTIFYRRLVRFRYEQKTIELGELEKGFRQLELENSGASAGDCHDNRRNSLPFTV